MSSESITPIPRAEYVQREFSRIAGRYEFMNQLMTFGSVNNWRRKAIRILDPQPAQTVLDLAAGGGQLTQLLLKQYPTCHAYPSDFNLPMMRVGQSTGLPFYAADALRLPHADASVDRVICAFLLRNVEEYPRVLNEILRILKPGGRFVCLDTTPPVNPVFKPFIYLHMHIGIPLIGTLVTGQFSAYKYLIRSSEKFTRAEKLAQEFEGAGFQQVHFTRLMLGTAAIHWGTKAL